MKRLLSILTATVFGIALSGTQMAVAQNLDLSKEESHEQIRTWAKETIDTSRWEKEPPYKIGVSAGYLSNSWILFASLLLRHEASLHPEISEVVVTDANFNPAKQTSDIEDLISQDIDLLLFWPVDENAMIPALQKATQQNLVTINVGYNFMQNDYVTGNAYVDQWEMTAEGARRFVENLGGEGKIFAMMPIAGSSAAVVQLAALKSVIADYPDIELLSVEYGDWNRAKAKQLTENLLQRFPQIDGAFSPAAQMTMGIVEAFEEAGRLDEVTLSPGDEYNGWLRWINETGRGSSMTSGLQVGRAAVRHGLAILKGEEGVTNAEIVPTEYLPTEEAAALYQEGRPDDWWPTDLPEEWLPE
ncbi:MAG: substrate-binding domain-containing protein [Rhodovibrionaceae bacterium]